MTATRILAGTVLLFLVALPLSSVAYQLGSSPLPSHANQDISGTITRVDEPSHGLTIKKTDGMEETFRVDEAAKITLDGKPAQLTDLKAGQKVTVSVSGNKVLSIRASAKPSA